MHMKEMPLRMSHQVSPRPLWPAMRGLISIFWTDQLYTNYFHFRRFQTKQFHRKEWYCTKTFFDIWGRGWSSSFWCVQKSKCNFFHSLLLWQEIQALRKKFQWHCCFYLVIKNENITKTKLRLYTVQGIPKTTLELFHFGVFFWETI